MDNIKKLSYDKNNKIKIKYGGKTLKFQELQRYYHKWKKVKFHN